jgi:hypothetical protein
VNCSFLSGYWTKEIFIDLIVLPGGANLEASLSTKPGKQAKEGRFWPLSIEIVKDSFEHVRDAHAGRFWEERINMQASELMEYYAVTKNAALPDDVLGA